MRTERGIKKDSKSEFTWAFFLSSTADQQGASHCIWVWKNW